MGKWSSLRGQLPAAPTDPDRAMEVAAAAEKLAGKDLNDLAALMNAAEDEKALIARRTSEINIDLEAIEGLMIKRMEATDLDSIKTAGYNYSSVPEPYPYPENREAVRKWFIDNEMINLLDPNPNRLKSMVKDMLTEGKDIPPGVKVYLKTTIRRTKAK